MDKKLTKDKNNGMFLGVIAGFAKYFNVDVTVLRILFLISVFCFGVGVLPYFIAALIMTDEKDTY